MTQTAAFTAATLDLADLPSFSDVIARVRNYSDIVTDTEFDRAILGAKVGLVINAFYLDVLAATGAAVNGPVGKANRAAVGRHYAADRAAYMSAAEARVQERAGRYRREGR